MNEEENKNKIEESKEELKKGDNFEDVEFIESTEDGEVLATKDVVKKLRENVKNLQKEKEDYLVGWQRAKADYINLQKEYEDSHLKTSVIIKEKFLRNLLPTLDSFDMAFANREAWEKVDKNWRIGVEYIYQQMITGIRNEGIERIDEINIPFDPMIHESIEVIETDKKENNHKIAKVIQVGYKVSDRVIRPARVNIYEYK